MKKLFFFAFFLGLVAAFFYSYWKINKATLTVIPQSKTEKKPSFSVEEPPKNSIKGKLESYSGVLKWESRVATVPAEVTIAPEKIQQGEVLETGQDGSALVDFGDIGKLEMSSDTKISFAQLLPDNFVFNQSSGKVTYTKDSKTPFSIRALHLLAKMENGKMVFEIDKETGEITITMKKGTATVGFNDLNNVSTIKNIEEGETLIYNDQTRETSTE